MPKTLSNTQYNVLLNLFNECNEDFWLISQESRDAFFDRLYSNQSAGYRLHYVATMQARAEADRQAKEKT